MIAPVITVQFPVDPDITEFHVQIHIRQIIFPCIFFQRIVLLIIIVLRRRRAYQQEIRPVLLAQPFYLFHIYTDDFRDLRLVLCLFHILFISLIGNDFVPYLESLVAFLRPARPVEQRLPGVVVFDHGKMICQRFGQGQLYVFQESGIPEHRIRLKEHQFRRLCPECRLQYVIGLLDPLPGLPAVVCGDPGPVPQIHRGYGRIALAVPGHEHVDRILFLSTDRGEYAAASAHRSAYISYYDLYPCGTRPQKDCKYKQEQDYSF